MSNGDGSALRDLSAENRDNRAVAAEDVSEADCYEFRAALSGILLLSRLPLVEVAAQHGQLAALILADLLIEALDYHFAESL